MPRTHRRLITPQILFVLALNIALLAGIALASESIVIEQRGNAFDFYPHWLGGRAFWNGETPYTQAVTDQIQLDMFGFLLPPDADQQNYAYPAYTSVVLGPLLWLPASTSISIWMALQFVSIIWSIVLWIVILRWRPAPWLFFLLILGLLFVFRYPIDLFVLAQFSGAILFLASLSIWLLMRGHDAAAGIALALAAIPPTTAGPLAVMILGAYALRGRWRGAIAFVLTLGVLGLISVLRIGWWLPDFLNVVRAYSDYATPAWAPTVISPVVGVLLVPAVVAALAFVLSRFPAQPTPAQQIDLGVTALLAALLLVPQTGQYYLVLLIPALLVAFHRAANLPRLSRRAIRAGSALAVISPWFFFLAKDQVAEESAVLILPLAVGILWAIASFYPDFAQRRAASGS